MKDKIIYLQIPKALANDLSVARHQTHAVKDAKMAAQDAKMAASPGRTLAYYLVATTSARLARRSTSSTLQLIC